jgi:hypothetical protein
MHQNYLASVRGCTSGATDIRHTVTNAGLLSLVAGVKLLRDPAWFPVDQQICIVSCSYPAFVCNRGGMRDLEIVRKFIRGPLTDAFDKVLLDSAINIWPENLQLQIFDAVTGLVDLTAAKLSQLSAPEDIDAAQAAEDEADLFALLEPLMHAFDPESTFNYKNSECTLPSRMPKELSSRYATPRAPAISSVHLGVPVDTDVEDCSRFTTFSWPAYFINYFGYRRGFQYIRQVQHA